MDTYSREREVEKPKKIALDKDVNQALEEIGQEVMRARANHSGFRSAHEGYAVILEEVDELWDEVRRNRFDRSPERMRAECRQIAAMAVKFMADVAPVPAK